MTCERASFDSDNFETKGDELKQVVEEDKQIRPIDSSEMSYDNPDEKLRLG